MTIVIISALAILIGIILNLHYVYKVESRLLEVQLQLDKQEEELNHIKSQLGSLQSDTEVIDYNLHVIIGNISNLKEELK